MTITREEAIRILSTRDAHGVLCGYTNGVTEALDMAIEALKAEPTGDLISRADAIGAWDKLSKRGRTEFDQVLMTLPSSDATKKKAELKENGDWDCPDVGCDECDHHRSVEWCSLAIPNHEKIDDTYKMVNEAFFEGFDVAEKRYKLLIETIEELEKKSADVEWIPITTSEPTTSNHVLVTYNWGDDDYDDYEVSELDYWVTKCAAEEGNKQCQMFIEHVIAWSFLPQPYKER